MNELDLRDIHLPDDVLWWPLAPGWWLLLVTIVIAAVGFWTAKRYYAKRALYRSCREEFIQLRNQLSKGLSDREALTLISSFLRRVLMSYEGRESSAGITGDEWTKKLNQLSTLPGFSDEQVEWLGQSQYQRNLEVDVSSLLRATGQWTKQLPREPNHV